MAKRAEYLPDRTAVDQLFMQCKAERVLDMTERRIGAVIDCAIGKAQRLSVGHLYGICFSIVVVFWWLLFWALAKIGGYIS